MHEYAAPLLACAVAFLVGSVPFGMILARIAQGGDLRVQGSGNIGATNVSRVLGFWPWGLLTFLLDMAKGALPVFVFSSDLTRDVLAERLSMGGLEWQGNELGAWAVALACVLGHCFSPWLRFRGGKGVATGFGVILVLSPFAACIGAIAFGLTFVGTRTGSLSSMAGLLAAAATHLVFEPLGPYLWMGAALLLVILVRHESNLDALLQDSEKKFS